MAFTKGVITFIGDYGKPEANLSKTTLFGVTTAAALDTLATALDSHTDCAVFAKHFLTITETGAAAPGSDANVDVKGQIIAKDPSDGSVHKWLIPAPIAADFEQQDSGDRYTAGALLAIVTAINTATGKSYVGLYGKKLQRS